MNGNPVASAWGIMKLNLMTLHYLIAGLSHGLMEPWGKCGKAAYQYAWRENISGLAVPARLHSTPESV